MRCGFFDEIYVGRVIFVDLTFKNIRNLTGVSIVIMIVGMQLYHLT